MTTPQSSAGGATSFPTSPAEAVTPSSASDAPSLPTSRVDGARGCAEVRDVPGTRAPTIDPGQLLRQDERHAAITGLREILALAEADLPLPTHVSIVRGELVAYVEPTDLPEWVIVLDLPAPDWVTSPCLDARVRVATWPESAFADLSFRISSSDIVPTEAEVTC